MDLIERVVDWIMTAIGFALVCIAMWMFLYGLAGIIAWLAGF